jgi:hypothetical protein
VEICIGRPDEKALSADCVIGLSLGALEVLQDIGKIKGRIILVNPPVPRRSLAAWFVRWLRFVVSEGLFLERQKFTKNPLRYAVALAQNIRLLQRDPFEMLSAAINAQMTVIRGKNDKFFCDKEAVAFFRSHNIKVIEVDGGHNWCEALEDALSL